MFKFMYQASSVSGFTILSASRAHLLELCAKMPEEHFYAPSLVRVKKPRRPERRRTMRKARAKYDNCWFTPSVARIGVHQARAREV